jgi:hypothetical protein
MTPEQENVCEISGKNPATLATAISDAIFAAIEAGMDIDEAASVTVAVAADYYRGYNGNDAIYGLAEVVTRRATYPLPGEFNDA